MNTQKLPDDLCEWLSNQTLRSKSQTQFLFELCDFDFQRLKTLEVQIKNCFVEYCPASKEKVLEVLQMQPKSNYFKLK